MSTKRIITTLLLLFVAGSLVYLAAGEVARNPNNGQAANRDPVKETVPSADAPGTLQDRPEIPDRVVVYYFHGTMRCPTCRKFEAYAGESLMSAFPGELASGRLEWRVINVDERENEHYVRDYELRTKSLIVSEVKNGEQTQWSWVCSWSQACFRRRSSPTGSRSI
ncbi:MAG: hypothetical protein COW52_08335 [Nitrospirae bacterium CG17_big_fil_post_rev_8_21_14_2_50_50_9]|nr:MAG: hypothetical protein COW52_08335 [Nitrospirae bacterium CG17_big_fil_post_rev_8_21_14_2_50_50_9]